MAILHLFYSQQSENKEKRKRKQKVIQNDITTGKKPISPYMTTKENNQQISSCLFNICENYSIPKLIRPFPLQ